MTSMKCATVRFIATRPAVDPRDGMLRDRFDASDSLAIEVGAGLVTLIALPDVSRRTVSALSNAYGATLLTEPAPASEPLPASALPGAKPVNRKAKGETK